MTLHKS